MARDAPPIAAGLFLVGSGLFSSPRVSAVSKQINAAPYRFSATDSCRCHVEASLIVSSLRPSFPQLRRSPPIPSLPWLLAADLFRGCSARRDSLPCHSAASQCTSIPSHRCFAISLMFGSKLRYSTASPVCSVLRLAVAFLCFSSQCYPCPCRIVWPRRHAVAILVVSLLSFSAPRSAISALVKSEPFNSTSIPLPVSSSPSAPFMAIPLHVASVRFLANPSHIYWM